MIDQQNAQCTKTNSSRTEGTGQLKIQNKLLRCNFLNRFPSVIWMPKNLFTVLTLPSDLWAPVFRYRTFFFLLLQSVLSRDEIKQRLIKILNKGWIKIFSTGRNCYVKIFRQTETGMQDYWKALAPSFVMHEKSLILNIW